MLKKLLIRWANRRSYRLAVKEADKKRAMTFKKYFVIFLAAEFQVVSKQRLKDLQKKKFFKPGISFRKLEKMAVYTTK